MVLEIKNICKKYQNATALEGVSFSLSKGEIVGLLGPNGAGKTTLINIVLGILEPDCGEVRIFGKNQKENRSIIAEKTNFSAVYAQLPPNLTPRQNLYIFGKIYGVKNLKEHVRELIEEYDLEKFENTKSGQLSSGEASRLSLAKAVINRPGLLLLDEPTASLDPDVSQVVREKIQNYVRRNRSAVLWTSHNMKEIEEVCDRVLFISKGKILLEGNPRTLPGEHGKKDLEDLFIAVAREPLTFEK